MGMTVAMCSLEMEIRPEQCKFNVNFHFRPVQGPPLLR